MFGGQFSKGHSAAPSREIEVAAARPDATMRFTSGQHIIDAAAPAQVTPLLRGRSCLESSMGQQFLMDVPLGSFYATDTGFTFHTSSQ
jgi:hypothetical protein